jgi:hypothetical protein
VYLERELPGAQPPPFLTSGTKENDRIFQTKFIEEKKYTSKLVYETLCWQHS